MYGITIENTKDLLLFELDVNIIIYYLLLKNNHISIHHTKSI